MTKGKYEQQYKREEGAVKSTKNYHIYMSEIGGLPEGPIIATTSPAWTTPDDQQHPETQHDYKHIIS